MTISNENTRIVITLPKKLKEELQKEAETQSRSLSNYILTILQNHKGTP